MKKWKDIALAVALLGLLVCLASHCNEPRLPKSRKEADRRIQKAIEIFCQEDNLDPGKLALHEFSWSENVPWWYEFHYDNDPNKRLVVSIGNRGGIEFSKSRYFPDMRSHPPVVPTGRPRMLPIGSEEAESKKDTSGTSQ